MTTQLTHNNYHTLENRFLTNSRIGDWLKCKRFFYERHITGQRPGIVITDALKVGKAVDTFLFEGESEFRKKFIAVSRRSIKNPPINVIELTEKQYEDILGMAEVLLRQPVVKDLADFETQKIISIPMQIGDHFTGLAGIPDWIKINGDKCIIVDLKTAFDADDRKYHYKCLDFGYYRQFAVMTIIIRKLYPDVKYFTYRHIVVEKDKDSIFNPFAFNIANERVEEMEKLIINNIIPSIAAEKNFLPKEVLWENALTVGAMDEKEWD